jgi:prepilin signal peptidase PulO-like enzyme (type II secretory pathway)
MSLFLIIISILFGFIVGSFLNVVVLRMHTGRSFVRGRSMCFTCNKGLNWFELIPILSFIFQRGKCRNCSVPLSIQYMAMELVTGALFGLIWFVFFDITNLVSLIPVVFGWIVVSCLVVAGMYDIRHFILPDETTYFFAGLGVLALFFPVLIGSDVLVQLPTWQAIISGPVVALPFALVWWISRGTWMGLGDAKLSLGIGWILGLNAGFSALIFSFWIGAVFVIGLVLYRFFQKHIQHKKISKLDHHIPFGPFLIKGFLAVYLSGFTLYSLMMWWAGVLY